MYDDHLRIPPHSIGAEQSVLGGIMLANSAYLRIADMLTDGDFYRTDHQLIFRALAEMAAEHKPLDVVTVSEWMEGRFIQRGAYKESFSDIIGGLSYLGDLAKDTPSSANITAYAAIVRNYSIRRQTLDFAVQLTEKAFEKTSDADELSQLLDLALSGAFTLQQQQDNGTKKGFVSVKKSLKQHIDNIKALAKKKGDSLLGVRSGFEPLDQQLSGFEAGKVYVVAGRPAMGKTTLGLNFIEGIAKTTGGVVAAFSLEMSSDQLISKMIASQGRLDFTRLRNPWQLSGEDWSLLDHGVTKISGMELYIDDDAKQSPASIRTRCYQLVQATGKPLTAVLIDYVQLMCGSRQYYQNRENEIADISGEIRALAKDFACPVILLAQLNRALEGRDDKRPIMSDLRESGALEQDASCIIFIYRDDVYNQKKTRRKAEDKGTAELIVAKHRGGETGTVRCKFIGEQQRFVALAKEKTKPAEESHHETKPPTPSATLPLAKEPY